MLQSLFIFQKKNKKKTANLTNRKQLTPGIFPLCIFVTLYLHISAITLTLYHYESYKVTTYKASKYKIDQKLKMLGW